MYAYYRAIDDLVDQPPEGWARREVEEELSRLQLSSNSAQGAGLLPEIARIRERYGIPAAPLEMIIDGARFDLDRRAIETMHDLIAYSVLVAGSVGMVMSHILGAGDDVSLEAASDLGVAMQLTNVLRDVAEDAQRGRLYLPRAELTSQGASLPAQSSIADTRALRRVLESVALEARRRYSRGRSGIDRLDPSVRFSIALATTLYSRILDKIEESDFDVFAGRVHVGKIEKWALVMPTYLHHRQVLR
jgi:phytoene synthase